MRHVAALLVLVTIFTSAGAARGDDAEDDARYRRILAAFEAHEGAEWRWWTGWTALYGVAAVGYGVLAATTKDDGQRAEHVVSSVKGGLAFGSMFVLRTRAPIYAADRLKAMDASTPAARSARLAEAQRLLRKTADDADDATALPSYLLADAVNIASGFVLWAGYDRPAGGWVSLVTGVVISHAAILTKPRWSMGLAQALDAEKRTGFVIAPTPGGMVINGSF